VVRKSTVSVSRLESMFPKEVKREWSFLVPLENFASFLVVGACFRDGELSFDWDDACGSEE